MSEEQRDVASQEANGGGDTVVDPDAPGGEATEGSDPSPARTSPVLVASIVGLAMIVGVGILLAANNGGGAAQATHHEGEQVAISGPTDDFARADDPNSLGGPPVAPFAWSADEGRWGVAGGSAVVSVPPPAGRALATTAVGGADADVALRFAKVADSGGLVFRYKDPANYWAVVAVPGYATWAVVRVVNGGEQVVGNTGLSRIADDSAVGVRLRGDVIDVVLDGQVQKTITDPTLRGAARVGMTARATAASGVRFDQFTATAAAPVRPARSPG